MNYTYLFVGAGLGGIGYYTYRNRSAFNGYNKNCKLLSYNKR